jgi:hypothetical protein
MNIVLYEEALKSNLQKYLQEYLEVSKKKDSIKNNRERIRLSILINQNETNLFLIKNLKKS